MSRRRGRRRAASERAGGSFFQRVSPAGWVLLGLVLGLAGSLYYAWVVDPVTFTEASPARFSQRHKEEYIFLVSQSYALNGEWEQAEQRLHALDDPLLNEQVQALLEAYVREGRPDREIRHLAAVAQRVGVAGAAVALFAPTPEGALLPTPTPTSTPATPLETATAVPSPTHTAVPTLTPTSTPLPSPTPLPNYRLLNQERLCVGQDAPRIEVTTLDAFLNPLPGVEVRVSWENGRDHFFTGFKPEQGAGYGDFTMNPDVSYSVELADGSPVISGLRIELCADGAAGGWQLSFQNLRFGASPTPETEE